MSDIQKQVEEFINFYNMNGYLPFTPRNIPNIVEWLSHQQQLIDSQAKEIEKANIRLREFDVARSIWEDK